MIDCARPTREAAVAYFDTLRNFAPWSRESLKSYVDGAVVHDAATDKYVLACHPHIEASIYSGETLDLSESELTKPQCRAFFQSGERTKLFNHAYFVELASKLPHIYSTASPMPESGHLMVLEDPEESAKRILESLAHLPPFRDDAHDQTGRSGALDAGQSRL